MNISIKRIVLEEVVVDVVDVDTKTDRIYK